MFRRSGKNPLEKESIPLYQEESHLTSPYKFGSKNAESYTARDQNLFFDLPSSQPSYEEKKLNESKPMSMNHFQAPKKEEPETTLGEGVTFRGELSFERLLRIDGTFEGELISNGKIIVGPKGKVKANINLKEAIIEGHVEGNIEVAERIELRGEAVVHGDITAKSLSIDEGVSIVGFVRVTPAEKVSA